MPAVRPLLILALAALALAPRAGAEPVPPEWESVGGNDALATGSLWCDWYFSLAFVTTTTGYRVFDAFDDVWTVHETPGDPMRELTAVAAVPRGQHDLFRGHRDPDGHGIIERSGPLRRDDLVHTSRGGRVADLEVTGYFDPLPVACTRALNAVAGELLASADTGRTWSEVTGHGHHDLTDLFCQWTDAIYVSGDAGVMFTPDVGATWQPCNDGLPQETVRGLWTRGPGIAIPAKAERDLPPYLLAAMSDGVYHTPADAIAWERVLATPAPRQIVVQGDPYTGVDHAFVITEDHRLLEASVGVWEWQDLGADLAATDIVGVASIYPEIYAATAADGLFRARFFGGASDVPPQRSGLAFAAAPNPFNPGTTLSFVAPRAGRACLTVHDLRGRLVATLLDRDVAVGPLAVGWRPGDLASGVYVARLSVAGEVATRSLTLVE